MNTETHKGSVGPFEIHHTGKNDWEVRFHGERLARTRALSSSRASAVAFDRWFKKDPVDFQSYVKETKAKRA